MRDFLNKIYKDRFSSKTGGIIVDEATKFSQTISTGRGILEIYLQDKSKNKQFPGDKAFKLYDTYGFPLELTEEIAKENGISVDMKGFEIAMERAQELSRQGGKEKFAKNVDWAFHIEGVPQTKFVGYEQLEKEGIKIVMDIDIDGQRVLAFDSTPFYAEGGGQTGDQGELVMDDGQKLLVKDVQKYGGVWLHFVE